MKIAIRFYDNDFYNTFYGVLEALMNGSFYATRVIKDKKKLCKVINEISYGMYLLYQNPFKRPMNKLTRQELKIKPKDILLDEEVDAFLLEVDGWDNAETFVLDTDLDVDSRIYSV